MSLTAQDLVAAAKKNIAEVDIAKAKTLLNDALVLDVREPAEYGDGCLPGAINIPRGVLEFKIDAHPQFKDKKEADILVYCKTGGRGALATEALLKLGYINAGNLAGGFTAWQENGQEVVKPTERSA